MDTYFSNIWEDINHLCLEISPLTVGFKLKSVSTFRACEPDTVFFFQPTQCHHSDIPSVSQPSEAPHI